MAVSSLNYQNASNVWSDHVAIEAAVSDGVSTMSTVLSLDAPSVVYHWKSHVLLDNVAIASGPATLVHANESAFDLRATQYDPLSGFLSVQIWLNPVTGISSLGFSANTDGAVNAVFTPSAAAEGWIFETNSQNANAFRLGALIDDELEGSLNSSTYLGTLSWQFQPGADILVRLQNIEVGNQPVPDELVAIQMEGTAQKGWMPVSAATHLHAASFASKHDLGGSFNGGVTAADALAALKLAVGLNPNDEPDDGSGSQSTLLVSPYQYIAAEVTGDGTVTSLDALNILKMSVGLQSVNGPSWVFVDERYDLWDESSQKTVLNPSIAAVNPATMAKHNQLEMPNLVGVIKGDVNGSWINPGSTTIETVRPGYFDMLATTTGVPIDIWGG